MTLEEMIKEYENLTEEQQAHVDASLDAQSDEGLCGCGKNVDDCPDSYSHMSQGY
jgi:hypothetical protein